MHFIKDNLFPAPPIFAAIAQASGTEPEEMHKVYNMGHRLEVYVDPADVPAVLAVAAGLQLEARVVGRTEASTQPGGANHVTVSKDGVQLRYS